MKKHYAKAASTLALILSGESSTAYFSPSCCINAVRIAVNPPMVVTGLFLPAFVASTKCVKVSAPKMINTALSGIFSKNHCESINHLSNISQVAFENVHSSHLSVNVTTCFMCPFALARNGSNCFTIALLFSGVHCWRPMLKAANSSSSFGIAIIFSDIFYFYTN